jgi:transposase-like protein
MLSYRYKALEPGVKRQVVDMAINGSGIRDTD